MAGYGEWSEAPNYGQVWYPPRGRRTGVPYRDGPMVFTSLLGVGPGWIPIPGVSRRPTMVAGPIGTAPVGLGPRRIPGARTAGFTRPRWSHSSAARSVSRSVPLPVPLTRGGRSAGSHWGPASRTARGIARHRITPGKSRRPCAKPETQSTMKSVINNFANRAAATRGAGECHDDISPGASGGAAVVSPGVFRVSPGCRAGAPNPAHGRHARGDPGGGPPRLNLQPGAGGFAPRRPAPDSVVTGSGYRSRQNRQRRAAGAAGIGRATWRTRPRTGSWRGRPRRAATGTTGGRAFSPGDGYTGGSGRSKPARRPASGRRAGKGRSRAGRGTVAWAGGKWPRCWD